MTRARERQRKARDLGRRERKSRNSPKLIKVLYLITGLALVVLFGSYIALRQYIHSENFRSLLESKLSQKIQNQATLAPLKWKGLSFNTNNVKSQSESYSIHADGIKGEVSMNNIKNGFWELREIKLRKLSADINLSKPREQKTAPVIESESTTNFITSLIPKKVNLSDLTIYDSDIRINTSDKNILLQQAQWNLSQASGNNGAYHISITNGEAFLEESPHHKLKLQQAKLRTQNDRIDLLESTWTSLKESRLQLGGEFLPKKESLSLYGSLEQFPLSESIPPSWKQKVQGDAHSEFQYSKTKNNPGTFKGSIDIQNGILTALPILDRLADYTQRLEFRKIAFDTASCDYAKTNSTLDITNIQLVRDGLLKITGDIKIDNQNLSGLLQVGITPGTLNRIPGAEKKVFTKRERGMLWTPVRISGTLKKPKEDLKKRLYLAAGQRMLELLPEKGTEAIKAAEDILANSPKTIDQTAKKVLEEGSDIIEKGTGLIFDIFSDDDDD